MKHRKDWNEKVVKDRQTRPIMTARASSSNFERWCNSKLFQSWWSWYRRLRCSADLAARGAAPFVLMKFNQWRQRLNFTVPSCIYQKQEALPSVHSLRTIFVPVLFVVFVCTFDHLAFNLLLSYFWITVHLHRLTIDVSQVWKSSPYSSKTFSFFECPFLCFFLFWFES